MNMGHSQKETSIPTIQVSGDMYGYVSFREGSSSFVVYKATMSPWCPAILIQLPGCHHLRPTWNNETQAYDLPPLKKCQKKFVFEDGIWLEVKTKSINWGWPFTRGVLGNEANTCMVIIGIHEPFLPYFSGQPVKPCLKCQVSGFHWISFSVGDLNKIQLLEDLDGKFWTLDPFLPYWDLRPLTVTSYVFGSNKLTNPPPKKKVMSWIGRNIFAGFPCVF